jgi:Asp-tRNA(Asn)/Glu-tRNA(Gln) amidotransferase A subunit family amidase
VAEEDLCYLGAVQALERFEAHELSPLELMTCLIERDQRIGGLVNALTDRYADEALGAASIAERRWMNGEARALEGVPVAVKDAQRVAGQRTTFGSPIFLRTGIRAASALPLPVAAGGLPTRATPTGPGRRPGSHAVASRRPAQGR